ncbi:MAG: hypothetical protein MRY59_14280 [Aquisalinus sp.]|nr:hypothetical protein [Aquisalinus sp.]
MMNTNQTYIQGTLTGAIVSLSQVSAVVCLLPGEQSAPDEGRENYSENVADPANVAPGSPTTPAVSCMLCPSHSGLAGA